MTLALLGGAGIVLALVVVYAVTYGQAGVTSRRLAAVGQSGLLAVLVAVGISLVGASLAFGLDAFVLAPPMLVVGLLLLALAGLSALQAALAGGRSAEEGDRERELPDAADGANPHHQSELSIGRELAHDPLAKDRGEPQDGAGGEPEALD